MTSSNPVNVFMSELYIVKPAADLVDDSCTVAFGVLYFSTWTDLRNKNQLSFVFMCSCYLCEVSFYPQDFVKFATNQPTSFNYVEPILDVLCTSDKYCICFIWAFFIVTWGFVFASHCCDIFIHDNLGIFSPIKPLISLTLFISQIPSHMMDCASSPMTSLDTCSCKDHCLESFCHLSLFEADDMSLDLRFG
jgi:hypothetical protein